MERIVTIGKASKARVAGSTRIPMRLDNNITFGHT